MCAGERRVRVSPPGSILNLKGGIFTSAPAVTTMAGLLTELGTVVTQALDWVGDIVNTIVTNPLLLLTTGFLVLGAAVGILGRILSKG